MIFRGHSSDSVATAASLAFVSYDYGGLGLQQQLATHAPAWNALSAAALGLPPGDIGADGYFDRNGAAGYVAVRGNAVAIVFRGSDDTADLIATATNQADYFDSLRPLIQGALNYAAATGAGEIVLAGHSLGGAMVQRTAAKIDQFSLPTGVEWDMTAFGAPGTDVGDKTSFSRTVLNLGHTGDPVPTDPLLSNLTQHGPFATIQLPNVEGANDLAELAQQKQAQDADPSIVTEHDMLRYLLSTQAIAGSLLLPETTDDTIAIVLDDPNGAARSEAFTLDEADRFLLGLAGDDTLTGSADDDLIDGGADQDLLSGGDGNDLLAGSLGNDGISGQAGIDTAMIGDLRLAATVTSVGDQHNVASADGTDVVDGSTEIIGFLDGRLFYDAETAGAQVYRLYLTALNREPDVYGFANWTGAVEAGMSIVEAAEVFLGSPESQAIYGGLDNASFVTALYTDVLGRAPDPAGFQTWTSLLDTGALSRAQVAAGFSESAELKLRTEGVVADGLWVVDPDAAFVLRAYEVSLDRAPDRGGLIYWTAAIDDGLSQEGLGNALVGSPEFGQLFGALDNSSFVEQLYLNAFSRPVDAADVANWTAYLDAGGSRGWVVTGFANFPDMLLATQPLVDDGVFFL